jgi:hypothetical protein
MKGRTESIGRKLTAEDVWAIRTRQREGAHELELADEFRVSRATIRAIVAYETWVHVGPSREE